MQSAAKQTVKVNTGNVKSSAKTNSSDDEFQKLYQLEQKRAKLLVDSAALTANGQKEQELKAVNDELLKTNAQMKELYTNIKNVLSEKQKLQLKNMDSEAEFKASRKTFNGADNTARELKKQEKANEDSHGCIYIYDIIIDLSQTLLDHGNAIHCNGCLEMFLK